MPHFSLDKTGFDAEIKHRHWQKEITAYILVNKEFEDSPYQILPIIFYTVLSKTCPDTG